MKVRLIASHQSPYNLSIASARTCYSSKGIIMPEEMDKDERARELRDRIAESTMEAGHLTTRQHAHFVFGLQGVSRNLIWQFLHAHPYYNSEQVSQRYVSIKESDWYSLPAGGDLADIPGVERYHERAMKAYRYFNELLEPAIEEIYYSIYRGRKSKRDHYRKDILKRAMEISRYVMPLSTTAYMYHTISALTLYRYARMMMSVGLDEAVALTLRMLIEVDRVDPDLIREVPEPLENSAEEIRHDFAAAQIQNRTFDEELANAGGLTRLAASTENSYELLSKTLKAFRGETASVEDVCRTDTNPALGDAFYPVTLDEQSRIFQHVHFTFQKKLSHTADSQEQRHRTLPGSRPLLFRQVSLEPDYIIPGLIQQNDKIKAAYESYMEEQFSEIKRLAGEGVPAQRLTYLLPNAFPVRFYESGDLMNFFHKWKSRLCYTAQEEIFYSSLEEVKQVIREHPFLEGMLGPPCVLRKSMKPRCPEGPRYCGVKVWNLTFDQYDRSI